VKTPGDRALSKIRVAKGTMIGRQLALRDALRLMDGPVWKRQVPKDLLEPVRECVAEALVFTERGIAKLGECHAELETALTEMEVPFWPVRGGK